MPRLAKGKGYSLDHAFKFYKEKHGRNVDLATYRKICYAFNKMLVDDVLEGKIVKLPHRLGSLWIKKYKINLEKLAIDFKATKEYGKTIYHLNEHSDGYEARWAWSKRNNLVRNLIYYSFTATRENSRRVSKVMQTEGGHKRYFT